MKRLLVFLALCSPVAALAQAGCSSGPNGCGQLNTSAFLIATTASAATIPLNSASIISGTAAINTITLPMNFSATVGGCYDILATGAWTTTTAGNIFVTFTAVPNTTYRACYFASKWYIK